MSETTIEPEFAPIPLLQRRQIEAEIVGPLLHAFIKRFGREACLDTAREVIAQLARESGAALAERLGSTTLDSFAQALELWRAGGSLELEVLEQSDQHLAQRSIEQRCAATTEVQRGFDLIPFH